MKTNLMFASLILLSGTSAFAYSDVITNKILEFRKKKVPRLLATSPNFENFSAPVERHAYSEQAGPRVFGDLGVEA